MEPSKSSKFLILEKKGNNSWRNISKEILSSWNPNIYGSILTFQWYEQDSGAQFGFEVNASYENKESEAGPSFGGKFTYSNTDGNDLIGEETVCWWESKTRIYDTGIMKWKFE